MQRRPVGGTNSSVGYAGPLAPGERTFMLRDQLEQRLRDLKAEYAAGQQMLTDLETRQATLRETLLRISGAIQVLEEELAKTAQDSAAALAPNAATGGSPPPPASEGV